jgi:hypothetical protein
MIERGNVSMNSRRIKDAVRAYELVYAALGA